MGLAQRQSKCILTSDYLEGERHSQIRYEYVDGELYAMAGASTPHEVISGNLFVLTKLHLRGSPCMAFNGGMKAYIEAANCYYYPDLMVTCEPRDRQTSDYKRYPTLIAVVLSPTTEAVDRGRKMRHYQQIDALQEYVLISQVEVLSECYRRRPGGCWEYRVMGPGSTLRLESIDLEFPIEQIYEDVEFEHVAAEDGA